MKRVLMISLVFMSAMLVTSDALASHAYYGARRGFFPGGGLAAANRSALLSFRAGRAAAFGHPFRAARLQVRANFAARRALRRRAFWW